MIDYKTILLIVGILLLVVIFTRKAILKQKQVLENPVRPPKLQPKKQGAELSDAQFERQWKSMSYLLFLAALGNLYSAYVSIRGAFETMSTVFWIDGILSIASAIVVVFVWRKKSKDLVYGYMGIIILQVMFFLSTGKYLIAMVHLFPLVIVYLVIKPVWNKMG